jgi:arsenite methyltransferase
MKNYLNYHFDYVKLVEVYDELPLWSAAFGLKLLKHITYKPSITALDIGFGTGFPLTEMAMRLGGDSLVYGIDPWTDAIQRVKKKIEYYGITNIRIFEGVAEAIPLANNSVDLITSNNGINNVEDIDKVISECSRVMKKGGQFIQTMNLDKSMFEFYRQLEEVLREMKMEKEVEAMHKHIEKKRPSIDSMLSVIERHGFVIDALDHDQFDYKFSNGSALFNHYFIRLAFMDSWIGLLPADKVEPVFDLVEKRLNEQSQMLGGISLSIPFAMINAIKE